MTTPPTYAQQCAATCAEPETPVEKVITAIHEEFQEQQEMAAIGKAWRTDSSLEKWFPFTAEELEKLREDKRNLISALQLDLAFHGSYFATQSLPDFAAAGYTGTDDVNEMRSWLNELKRAALAAAKQKDRQ